MRKDSQSRTLRIAAVSFCLVFPTVVTLAYFVWFSGQSDAARLAYGAGKCLQFAFPAVFALLCAREHIGFPKRSLKGIRAGLSFGIVVGTSTLLVYYGFLRSAAVFESARGAIEAKLAEFGLMTLAAYLCLAIFYSLAHSLMEEYYWRWFVFGQLRVLVSRSTAIGVSCVGFMAHHVIVLAAYFGWTSPLTYLFSASVAVGGAFWAWLYDDSQSLIGPWLSHALVDAAIFTAGYNIIQTSL